VGEVAAAGAHDQRCRAGGCARGAFVDVVHTMQLCRRLWACTHLEGGVKLQAALGKLAVLRHERAQVVRPELGLDSRVARLAVCLRLLVHVQQRDERLRGWVSRVWDFDAGLKKVGGSTVGDVQSQRPAPLLQ